MRVTSDGVVYYPSDQERNIAGLQIRQHQRPIRPFKELVDTYVAGMSKYVERIEVRSVEAIVTQEGEYGAFTSIVGIGKADSLPVLAVLAVVCGDDWYDRFDGWMSDASRFDHYIVLARDAVTKHVTMLGRHRARRFQYVPPVGWQALQRDLLVQWFLPDYPKHHSVITVAPAFPGKIMPSASAEAIIGRRFVSFKKAGDATVENVTFDGLGGVVRHDIGRYEIEGLRATHMLTAALVDPNQTMTYLVRLETTDEYLEQDRKHFGAICESIRPVPMPAVSTTNVDSALMMMWAE